MTLWLQTGRPGREIQQDLSLLQLRGQISDRGRCWFLESLWADDWASLAGRDRVVLGHRVAGSEVLCFWLCFWFCFVFCHAVWCAGPYFPDEGLNPCPRHWEQEVLTTGSPGKSLKLILKCLSWLSTGTVLLVHCFHLLLCLPSPEGVNSYQQYLPLIRKGSVVYLV